MYTIVISQKYPEMDAHARGTLADIRDHGLAGITRVEVDRVYRIEGDLSREAAELLATRLFVDPVVETWAVYTAGEIPDRRGANHVLEVAYNPGVMDPVEGSVLKASSDLGVALRAVRTAARYRFYGEATASQILEAAYALLANKTVNHVVMGNDDLPKPFPAEVFRGPAHVELVGRDDESLMAISRSRGLSLSVSEMRRIRDHFEHLGRNPTDIELETLAQTWSEHCVHKTFKGRIEFGGEVIDNLLKQTIVKATRELAKPWCVSVFDDNAGVIEFDERNHVCFKVETHNHPSALEPYGGAGTGIGGVIRDVLGTGLGAKPVANTDVFCFARPDYPADEIPEGILHPRRIMRGVVAGVRDYGNRMGVPTVNGAVIFDDRYLGNPLVYCGTVGLLPVGSERKTVLPGMKIVVVGGRTGRDGIHGATFSSAELGSDEENVWSNAVQIGNPITEKKVTDVLMMARDRGLYSAITDCGAGGLSSAVGEMGERTGAVVDLERAPLKYEGLSYTEVWISEAQERMVLAVPPQHAEELLALFESENVEATVIGEFTGTGRLVMRYHGVEVADLDMKFLHKGVPQVRRKAVWQPREERDPVFEEPASLNAGLLALLSHPTIASKEWIIRQYDHEVQGGSALKPLVGAENDGPSDASVIRPVLDSGKGVLLANGINPRYSLLDPYFMALAVIDEAIRQVVAAGGNRGRTALLDNFCWGNPENPERLGELVRAARGCYDAAKAFETPFISGKDSFYNEYAVPSGTIAIPPTLLISAICVIEDVQKLVSMDLKEPGHFVYVVGLTRAEMGGSHYWMLRDAVGHDVPKVDLATAPTAMDKMSAAIRAGCVRACHDCSEGGIGVAVAEMAFSGGVGCEIDLGHLPADSKHGRSDILLFSESPTRWICEVPPDRQMEFETIMEGTPFGRVGQTTAAWRMRVTGLSGNAVIDLSLEEMKEAWQRTLREV